MTAIAEVVPILIETVVGVDAIHLMIVMCETSCRVEAC